VKYLKQKNKLKQLTKAAPAQRKKVRLWASPENEVVWKEFLLTEVDLINSDHPGKLKLFLLKINNLILKK
jgi:hypothetical protein